MHCQDCLGSSTLWKPYAWKNGNAILFPWWTGQSNFRNLSPLSKLVKLIQLGMGENRRHYNYPEWHFPYIVKICIKLAPSDWLYVDANILRTFRTKTDTGPFCAIEFRSQDNNKCTLQWLSGPFICCVMAEVLTPENGKNLKKYSQFLNMLHRSSWNDCFRFKR